MDDLQFLAIAVQPPETQRGSPSGSSFFGPPRIPAEIDEVSHNSPLGIDRLHPERAARAGGAILTAVSVIPIIRPASASSSARTFCRSIQPVGRWKARSTARSSPSRSSGLASAGPTPFSAGASANSGLRISGRMTIWPLPQPTARIPKRPPANCHFGRTGSMDRETRLRRLRFRAWHRGTKEADLLIGGFFDRYHNGWTMRRRAGSRRCWRSRMSTSWPGRSAPARACAL
jgi:hypothetical protein